MTSHNDRSAAKQRAPLPMLARAQTNAANPIGNLGAPATQQLNPRYLVPPQDVQGPLSPRDFSNTPLTNLPLYIPGATPDVVGFDLGINKAALDVHLDKGLLCNLLPYLGMAAGDFCALHCIDLIAPVDIYNVTQDDVDNQRIIPMYIPRTRLVDGPAFPIFIRVTPVGGNSAETPHLNAKVDTERPGGRNPVASTLQNENLHKPIFPQRIIDFGVSDQDAQNGVPVTFNFYPEDTTQAPSTYRAARDRIKFSVNGVQANFPPITEAQAAGQQPITYTLYYGFWQQVGSGFGNGEYHVIDEVGNASDGFSPAQPLSIRLDDGAEPWLPAALILEAPANFLDHDVLNGKDATILINTPNPDFQINDHIRVTVVGRAVDGTTITKHYDHGPILSPSFFALITFPNADVGNLVGGRLQLTYERIRNGTPNRQSHGTNVDVIGTPIDTNLPSPSFVDAVGGVLDPTLLIVNVQVPVHDNRDPSDLVTLFLYGQYANGNAYYRELYKPAGTGMILFKINNGPNGEIAKLEGGTLRARYEVTNIDGTRPSLDVTVQVGSAVASLPEPRILDALPPAYQYDPDATVGDADIEVKSNLDFKVNDTIYLHCEGTTPGGTQPPVPFKILPFWVGLDLPFTLERQYILPNLNQTMRIYYERKRDNELTRRSHAVTMKVGTRLELLAPKVLNATLVGHNVAELKPENVLPPLPTVVTIRVTTDTFPPNADVKLFIIGTTGPGTPNIPAKPATPEAGTNYISFVVGNTFVGANLGQNCIVYYNLIQTGKTTKSEELTLRIEALDLSEDTVTVPEAVDGVINANLTNHVEVGSPPYGFPFMKAGTPLWVNVEGVTDLVLRNGNPVTAQEFNARRTQDLIPKSYLEGQSGNITINARASLDGSNSSTTAVPFPAVSYALQHDSEVIKFIPLDFGIGRILITPDSKKIYAINSYYGSIHIIDAQTHTLIKTLPTPRVTGASISSDGTRLYVSRLPYQAPSYVEVYSTVTDQHIDSISVQGWAESNLVNADSSKIYVTSISQINIYNLPSKTLRKTINTNIRLGGYFYNKDQFYTYIIPIEGTRSYLYSLNQAVDSLGSTPDLGGPVSSVAFHHSRLRAFYTADAKVGILNLGLNTVVGELSGFTKANAIACHPTLNRAYVADSALSTVTVLDTSSDSLQKIQILSDFNTPTIISPAPNGKFVYVYNLGSTSISVIKI